MRMNKSENAIPNPVPADLSGTAVKRHVPAARTVILFTLMILLLCSCRVPHEPAVPTPTETPPATETPVPEPTATIPPSAAVVNGTYIAIEDLEARIRQLKDVYPQLGEPVPNDNDLREEALNALIDETLFLTAAQKSGTAPTPGELDGLTQELCAELGSCDALRSWQEQNHYSGESFRRALERETAISRMRESIFARLKDMEQMHIYRIRSDRRQDLDEVMSRLNMGISFTELAKNYDDVTGGDMSWIPRGVLFSKDAEDKIFALNTGEHTDIMEIDGTYNIFYAADKQSGRQMDTQVEQIAQRRILADWLEEQKNAAEIEILQ